jgi:hypothetical protein
MLVDPTQIARVTATPIVVQAVNHKGGLPNLGPDGFE